MDYLEFNFTITPVNPGYEILTAILADIGFESFMETETDLLAYISSDKFSVKDIENMDILKNGDFSIGYKYKIIKDKNWNEEWESNYSPVFIAGKCCVRNPFHPKDENYKYDIIIEPKMSFGTAHHETTSLMIGQIMALDLKGKRVLDMGCGTAVLAILAAKMGTSNITAIDIDEGAFYNSIGNIERNQVGFIKVLLGDAKMIDGKFDVIFSNINRNILINDIPVYAKHLNKSGFLLLSGFYETDIPVITDKAKSCNMKFLGAAGNNNWAFLKFQTK